LKETLKIKGFYKVELRNAKTGELEGLAEGENVVTEVGFDNFLVNSLSADLSGLTISHGAIGSATAAPNSTNTSLAGEFETREDLTGSLETVGTLLCAWSYATDEGNASEVARVGLFNSVSTGSMFSEATFSSSQKTTDQTLSISYRISFS
jgi:hypothetical protein